MILIAGRLVNDHLLPISTKCVLLEVLTNLAADSSYFAEEVGKSSLFHDILGFAKIENNLLLQRLCSLLVNLLTETLPEAKAAAVMSALVRAMSAYQPILRQSCLLAFLRFLESKRTRWNRLDSLADSDVWRNLVCSNLDPKSPAWVIALEVIDLISQREESSYRGDFLGEYEVVLRLLTLSQKISIHQQQQVVIRRIFIKLVLDKFQVDRLRALLAEQCSKMVQSGMNPQAPLELYKATIALIRTLHAQASISTKEVWRLLDTIE